MKCKCCQEYETINIKLLNQVIFKKCKKCRFVKLDVKRFNKIMELYLYRYPQNINLFFNTSKTLSRIKIHTFLKYGLLTDDIIFRSVECEQICDVCKQKLRIYNHNGLNIYFCQKDDLIYFNLDQFFRFLTKLCNICKKDFIWLRFKMFIKRIFFKEEEKDV